VSVGFTTTPVTPNRSPASRDQQLVTHRQQRCHHAAVVRSCLAASRTTWWQCRAAPGRPPAVPQRRVHREHPCLAQPQPLLAGSALLRLGVDQHQVVRRPRAGARPRPDRRSPAPGSPGHPPRRRPPSARWLSTRRRWWSARRPPAYPAAGRCPRRRRRCPPDHRPRLQGGGQQPEDSAAPVTGLQSSSRARAWPGRPRRPRHEVSV
jgi:hypothetical protein